MFMNTYVYNKFIPGVKCNRHCNVHYGSLFYFATKWSRYKHYIIDQF